jgi:type II secretory pathway component HofQ
MTERLQNPLRIALTLLTFAPALILAQSPSQVTVDYQNAPLSTVVRNFAAFSGRTIAVAPGVGDALVTTSIQGVDWEHGLDHILAAESLIARPDSGGGLRIEKERRISVEYQNARLSQIINSIAAFGGHAIVIAPNVGDPQVTAAVRDVDWQRALDQVLRPIGFVARPNNEGVFLVERP